MESTAWSWRGQLGRRWKADDTKLRGMHETDDSDLTLVRLLQGKGSVKYAHEDSYKEKTSNPRKGCQPFTTIKAPIPLLTKVRIIHPNSGTLELWEVLTWHSEGIWPTLHWCSLLGILFFMLHRCYFEHMRIERLTIDFLASSVGIVCGKSSGQPHHRF